MRQLDVDPNKILLVLNKIDLVARVDESAEATLFRGLPLVRVSAVRGDGLRQLRNRIFDKTLVHR
jgi:50S ribosomal subunit-associated GTPase HflX